MTSTSHLIQTAASTDAGSTKSVDANSPIDAATASNATALITTITIWLISSVLVAWFEFGVFWNLPLLLFAMNLDSFDQALVLGSLLARTLIVTSPALILLSVCIKNQWHWKWKAVAWAIHFSILVWIVVDCGLQCVTGANLWHYVQKAATTEDLTVGGDISLLLSGIKSALSIIAFQIIVVAALSQFVAGQLSKSRWQSRIPRFNQIGLMAIATVVLAVVAARPWVTQRPALEQLYGTITLRTWLFHPDRISEYGEAAFGRECQADFRNLQDDFQSLFRSDVCRKPLFSASNAPTKIKHTPYLLTGNPPASAATKADSPNIILLLTESLRHDALTQNNMPELWKLAQQGLLANQHSTNSNCSEFGAFTSLYGRYAMCYDSVLDDQVPSLGMQTLKQLGYQRQMVNSCSVNFSRMNEFLSELNFDRISIHNPKGNPWHDNDRRTLEEIGQLVTTSDLPQFVFSILMATHYSYDYPAEYDQQSPNSRPALTADAASHEVLEDRYWKSVSFLDQQISALIKSVEGTNTIVIVTGDHGESFLDDGFLCHGTRLSKIQTQTPLLIIGPGIGCGKISEPTGHIDLMPTILNLAAAKKIPQHSISTEFNCTGPGCSLLNLVTDTGWAGSESASTASKHGLGKQRFTSNRRQRSQLVVQARINDWEIALQHPDGILAFQTSRTGGDLKVTGFLNDSGRIDSDQKRQPNDIPKWNQYLGQAFHRAASNDSAAISEASQRKSVAASEQARHFSVKKH
ncbi:MAG: sulfatase-like hydrolase/transferase [Fuerstiella sp.]